MSPRLRLRHWKRWVVGSALAIAALIVGGPFIYIHFIEGTPPPPFRLPATGATNGSRSTSTASLTGIWKVGSGSQAGYRVKEVLFGQDNEAVGRTTAVTGQLTIDQTHVATATVTVDLTKVTSDRSQRDNQYRGRIMDTSTYPTATFTLTDPITLATVPPDGTTITAQATGNLELRGKTRRAAVQVSARRNGDNIQVSGSIPVTFSDWNIPNPSFGPVTTQDHGLIEFLLTLSSA